MNAAAVSPLEKKSARHVVVIGAGLAGTAAAWAASAGARVTVVDGGAGASSFWAGAIDVEPWNEIDRLAREGEAPPSVVRAAAPMRAFAEALGGWALAEGEPLWLATVAGRVRPASGRDRSLLNLGALARHHVLVPRADRGSWDADALAAAWTDDAPRSLDLSFEAIDGPVLRYDDERRIADGELAMRHDDPPRLAWLAERLRVAASNRSRSIAVVVGPWLGADLPRADALAKAIGIPVGEALSGTAGSAGLRFEAARARLLAGRAAIVRGRVARVAPEGRELVVSFAGEERSLRADAVVLAIGGILGGGIRFEPPTRGSGAEGATRGRPAFSLSLELPGELVGGSFPVPSSMHGPVLDETAWPDGAGDGALEAVGLAHEGGALSKNVFVAGDVRRGGRRTIVEAVLSGISAGERAAGEALTSSSPRAAGILRPA